MERRDILWFFQWLKLAVDLDGKNIEFNKQKNSAMIRSR